MEIGSERGFTLIELLTVIGVVGIMSGLAVIQSREFIDLAYNVQLEAAIHDGFVALETGISDIENRGTSSLVMSENGTFGSTLHTGRNTQTANGTILAPGLAVSEHIILQVSYNPVCFDAATPKPCITQFVLGCHMKTNRQVAQFKWQGASDSRTVTQATKCNYGQMPAGP